MYHVSCALAGANKVAEAATYVPWRTMYPAKSTLTHNLSAQSGMRTVSGNVYVASSRNPSFPEAFVS